MSRPSRHQHNGLVDLRNRAGLTQACAAARVGVSQVVLYLWEVSHRPIPENRRADLARVLGCSVAEVLAATANECIPDRAAPKEEQPPPRFVDPACPSGWRYLDEESRDGQARYAAWAEREAELTVTAAQIRYRVRHGRVA